MKPDKECWNCGHYLTGGGCYQGGRIGDVGTKRVEAHDHCKKWAKKDAPGSITAEQTAWDNRLA